MIAALLAIEMAFKPDIWELPPDTFSIDRIVEGRSGERDHALRSSSCTSRGGELVRAGFFAEWCVFPTQDAGTECRDSDQCLGKCVTVEWRGFGAVTTGVCSDYDRVWGCFQLVEDGVAGYEICGD